MCNQQGITHATKINILHSRYVTFTCTLEKHKDRQYALYIKNLNPECNRLRLRQISQNDHISAEKEHNSIM